MKLILEEEKKKIWVELSWVWQKGGALNGETLGLETKQFTSIWYSLGFVYKTTWGWVLVSVSLERLKCF